MKPVKKINHTPGPWRAERPRAINVFDTNTHIIKHVRKDGQTSNWDIAVATHARDASLIAAAPELLEVLEIIANSKAIDLIADDVDITGIALMIRSAIAKATGCAE